MENARQAILTEELQTVAGGQDTKCSKFFSAGEEGRSHWFLSVFPFHCFLLNSVLDVTERHLLANATMIYVGLCVQHRPIVVESKVN